MIAPTNSFQSPSVNCLHTAFLALLPRIQTHASIYFRAVRCPVTRADRIAECTALAWKWFVRLHERGKDINQFSMVFVYLVARAVKSGRQLCGQEKAKDVLSCLAQQRHGFKVQSLPMSNRTFHSNLYAQPHAQEVQVAFEERLRDNTITPPPEQAAFRTDYPAWRRTRTERDRRLIDDLVGGARTLDVAKKYGLSPGRVSQLRRDFMEDWTRFCGETIIQK